MKLIDGVYQTIAALKGSRPELAEFEWLLDQAEKIVLDHSVTRFVADTEMEPPSDTLKIWPLIRSPYPIWWYEYGDPVRKAAYAEHGIDITPQDGSIQPRMAGGLVIDGATIGFEGAVCFIPCWQNHDSDIAIFCPITGIILPEAENAMPEDSARRILEGDPRLDSVIRIFPSRKDRLAYIGLLERFETTIPPFMQGFYLDGCHMAGVDPSVTGDWYARESGNASSEFAFLVSLIRAMNSGLTAAPTEQDLSRLNKSRARKGRPTLSRLRTH